MSTCIHEFFQGFANHAAVTLHIDNLRGVNAHHQAETIFKAFGRALAHGGRSDARLVGAMRLDKVQPVTAQRIAVVDYGKGNLSIPWPRRSRAWRARRGAGHRSGGEHPRGGPRRVSGVGAIRDCMGELGRRGLAAVVRELSSSGRPLLAICVAAAGADGLQRGKTAASIVSVCCRVRYGTSARRSKDEEGNALKVPHMGWNRVQQRCAHPQWAGIDDGNAILFRATVFSYRRASARRSRAAATTGSSSRLALARDSLFRGAVPPGEEPHRGLALLCDYFCAWGRPMLIITGDRPEGRPLRAAAARGSHGGCDRVRRRPLAMAARWVEQGARRLQPGRSERRLCGPSRQ
jgi:glutamine amidotransferase